MAAASSQPVANLAQLVVDITGPWGRWQLKFFILFLLFSVLTSWHALQLTFQAPNVDYWCADEGDEEVNQTDKCFLADRSPCTKWNYDVGGNASFYHSTIISEWNLVCHRKWMASFSHSAYMTGSLVAGLLMAHCSDRIGRRPTMFIGWAVSLVATLSAALSFSMIQFLISRLLIAFGLTTCYSTAFVMLLEIVGPKYRESIGLAIEFGWAAGYITLPGLAWLVRDFRHLLYICAAFQLLLAVFYSTITESPRWLLANGRYSEAIAVLRNAVTINGDNNNANIEEKIASLQREDDGDTRAKQSTTDNPSSHSLLDLFSSWTLVRMTLLIYFIWFSNSLVYYGLSLNTNNLAGDPFINFLLMGLIEVPAYLASIYLVKWFGSKKILLVTLVGACLGCWASVSIQYNWYLGIAMALFGKFCVTSSYAIIYLYTVQVFPTVVRTIALGSCSVVARFGAISAPYIKDLSEHTSLVLSMVIVGMIALLAAVAMIPLNDSSGTDMPDRPEDVERQRAKQIDKAATSCGPIN